jgi:Protein of unknown function (DUF2000)
MAYENNHRKFAVIVNRSHPVHVVMNAVAHTAFGLAHKVSTDGRVLAYTNQATGFEARISEYPFIVLESKNGSQLATLLEKAREDESISYNVFTTSMLGASADAQIIATARAPAESLDLVLLVLFGDRDRVDPLTKRFSLLKA